jgi:protein O-GlcNAc transferase
MASSTPTSLLDVLAVPLLIAGLVDQLTDRLRRWRTRGEPAPVVDLQELYRRGEADERAGRLAAACDLFEEVVRGLPDHAPAHARLAALATGRGDHQVALAHALHALRAETSVDTLLAAADASAAAGRIDDALALYRDVLARDAEHVWALRRLRDAAWAATRWADALSAQDRLARLAQPAERAAERNTLAAIHCEMGAARLAQRDAAGAVSALRDAIRVQADFVPAHVALGDAHLLAGDAAQAVRAWERGLDAAPAALPLLSRLAQRHHDEGRPRRMIALYERAAARAPESLAIQMALGRVYFELSMLDEAADQFEKVEVRARDLPAIHAYLGRTFERRGQLREACEEYRLALPAGGDVAWPHRCAACEAAHAGWAERCPSCRQWNTLQP